MCGPHDSPVFDGQLYSPGGQDDENEYGPQRELLKKLGLNNNYTIKYTPIYQAFLCCFFWHCPSTPLFSDGWGFQRNLRQR